MPCQKYTFKPFMSQESLHVYPLKPCSEVSVATYIRPSANCQLLSFCQVFRTWFNNWLVFMLFPSGFQPQHSTDIVLSQTNTDRVLWTVKNSFTSKVSGKLCNVKKNHKLTNKIILQITKIPFFPRVYCVGVLLLSERVGPPGITDKVREEAKIRGWVCFTCKCYTSTEEKHLKDNSGLTSWKTKV